MGPLSSQILQCRESGIVNLQPPVAQAGPNYISGSRKCKQSSGPCLSPESEISQRSLDQEEDLQHVVSASQGKKVKIASEYAYQTLFLSGETSDVKVRALGKVWCLHKMFLCLSGYFATMFRGFWEESHKDIIDLEINTRI